MAVPDSPPMHRIAIVLGLALLSGCATHPITGREQILALPAVQTVYADVGFALSAGGERIAASPPCEPDCGRAEDPAVLAGRVERIGARLEVTARGMAPDLFERIAEFQFEVNDGLGVGTGSSASGRIALGSGLAGLEPTDTVVAFLIAREMAHVIARHAEEDSGASLVLSALGVLLLPGLNVIVRFVATTAGANALTRSWAKEQQREADEIAVALLERSGVPVLSVALDLESGVRRARLPDDDWGARYRESTRRVSLKAAAAPAPRYAVFRE